MGIRRGATIRRSCPSTCAFRSIGGVAKRISSQSSESLSSLNALESASSESVGGWGAMTRIRSSSVASSAGFSSNSCSMNLSNSSELSVSIRASVFKPKLACGAVLTSTRVCTRTRFIMALTLCCALKFPLCLRIPAMRL
jgi:hypothetical protein